MNEDHVHPVLLPGRESAYEQAARDLAERGWHVAEGFLTAVAAAALAAEARGGWAAGEFRPAGVGRGQRFQVSGKVRGDHIHWLDALMPPQARRFYSNELEGLRQAINRELLLGLFEFEGHFAVYPPGSFYRRHLDRFGDCTARKVTIVLYLNAHWRPEHGGALRLYTEGEAFVDVPPRGGTLVCFLSERFEHEVRPCSAERYSLTGWFRTREGPF